MADDPKQSANLGSPTTREGTNAVASPFTLFATNIVGQMATTTYMDTNAADAGPFFYRVGVQLP